MRTGVTFMSISLAMILVPALLLLFGYSSSIGEISASQVHALLCLNIWGGFGMTAYGVIQFSESVW